MGLAYLNIKGGIIYEPRGCKQGGPKEAAGF